MIVLGGIYIYKDDTAETAAEFGLGIGRQHIAYFGKDADIFDLHENIECGQPTDMKLLEGYSFGISKRDKSWHVRDTGFKNCKDEVFKGFYKTDNFAKQVESLIKGISG